MELQLDMIILWNTACITFATFYVTFKFRRDFIKLKEDIGDIKMMLALEHENNIIITEKLQF